MKQVRVILSPEAEEVFEYLNSRAEKSKHGRVILNAVKHKSKFIKSNPYYGEPIKKSLIPNEYISKYEITNLFWVELLSF